jgi:hypothetical protein
MKTLVLALIPMVFLFTGCGSGSIDSEKAELKILYLHHSTGDGVWKGDIYSKNTKKSNVRDYLAEHNKISEKKYFIKEQTFPKQSPYGWKNYPYDYYNIWVKNAGDKPYKEEPTLEILTKEYDVISFKHCFPVSAIEADLDSTNIDSEVKTLANYKLQYAALKTKLHSFPETKFIVWTGAALTKEKTNEEAALRAQEFFNWVKSEWDEEDDNIYLWDFREIETEGGLYLKAEYAVDPMDSHPTKELNQKASQLFVNRLTDIIENDGKSTNLKGEEL